MICWGLHCIYTRTKENNEWKEDISMACGLWINSFQKLSMLIWCSDTEMYHIKVACTSNIVRFIFDLVLSSCPNLRKPLRIHLSINCYQFCGVFCILFCFWFFIKVDPQKPKSGLGKRFIHEEKKIVIYLNETAISGDYYKIYISTKPY